ncbi:hypothetical protein JD969_12200 [Planctomycetota bacterium]|nr:hypothetical protein JD969_12200 [Planctomycetota bacterium]
MNTTTDIAPDAPITQDLVCINCNYNLRTLTPSQLCPECGHPISITLNSTYLCFASTPYLKTLHFAYSNILFATTLLLLCHTIQALICIVNHVGIDNIFSFEVLDIITTYTGFRPNFDQFLGTTAAFAYFTSLFISCYFIAFVILLTKKNSARPKRPFLIAWPYLVIILSIIIALFHIVFQEQHLMETSTLLRTFQTLWFLSAFYITYFVLFRFCSHFIFGHTPSPHAKPLRLLAYLFLLPFAINLFNDLFQHFILYPYFSTGRISTPPQFINILSGILHYSAPFFNTFNVIILTIALVYIFRFRLHLKKLIKNQTTNINN